MTVSQLGTDVGIMVSHDRIAQQIETSYTNNDFVTQLFVYGEDGRTISSYNPTGQKYITDLSYVANTEFMSQSLIDALDSYKTYVDGKEGELQTHLNTIKQYQADIENLKSSQSALNAEIESLLSELDDFIAEYAGTDPGT
ncbi:MAG: hypothetical protein K9L56_14095 [Clostridiales bacterium]|nr:hypothetical protein [Clostridiales bacterium]